ncbi:MAG: GFA family protein [Myxococcota bacterium]
MRMEGGCYCKQIRYEINGEMAMKAQCFCRECQYITGGDSLLTFAVPEDSFRVTHGELKNFSRDDLDNAVTRQFCATCGTHVSSIAMPGMVLVKVGTLDDRSNFAGPDMAIFTCDAQAYHAIPEGIPTFEKVPG